MISWKDLYTVLTAVAPLYVAMILAYGSVKWWKIFSPDQCAGVNRFVAIFAVPLLSFHFISTNDPYAMNVRFILADTIQKVAMFVMLTIWSSFSKNGSLDWMITIFSLSTLPNTLVMGIPLLIAMYGSFAGSLMVQVVVMQCIVWYTLLLFLFEYRGAKMLITEQFPDTAASIISFKVDPDVVSLDGRDLLQADAEVGDDGKLHVTVRKSTSSRRSIGGAFSISGVTPRPSNLTGAEIYSLSSSRNATPRGSNFHSSDLHATPSMIAGTRSKTEPYSLHSSKGPTPRPSNFGDRNAHGSGSVPLPRFGVYPNLISDSDSVQNKRPVDSKAYSDPKELHMFVWSASTSPMSESSGLHVYGSPDFYGGGYSTRAAEHKEMLVPDQPQAHEQKENEVYGDDGFSFPGTEVIGGDSQMETVGRVQKLACSSTTQLRPKPMKHMPPPSVMTRLILIMVWRKLIRNPNTYSSLIGLLWSLVSFRWNVDMPEIIVKSISILSDAGLGMAMFSLGLFMALQPKIIACGNSVAGFAMAVRFLTGPAVMAAASLAVGIRGVLLHVSIVQAALPQGLVPFVFAREYNVHPTILSTGVIFGMLIALPITLIYYVLLGL